MKEQGNNKLQPFLSWKWIGLIWVIMGLVSATTLYFNLQSIRRPTPWLNTFSVRLLVWLFWGGWAFLVFQVAKSFRFSKGHFWISILIHLPFCLFFILVNIGFYASVA